MYGIKSGSTIWERPQPGPPPGQFLEWEQVPGSASNVSSSGNGWIWAVDPTNGSETWPAILKCRKPCTGNVGVNKWQSVPGSLTQLSGGEKYLWGVNGGNNIFYIPIDGSGPGWYMASGAGTNVSAVGKYVWLVGTAGDIWRGDPNNFTTWTNKLGNVGPNTGVIAGGDESNGNVWLVDGLRGWIYRGMAESTEPDWVRVDLPNGVMAKWITAGDPYWIWAVSADDKVWRRAKGTPDTAPWIKSDDTFSQIDSSPTQQYYEIFVGSSDGPTVVDLPFENMLVDANPINPQGSAWPDQFQITVEGKKATIKRCDGGVCSGAGWGQQLMF